MATAITPAELETAIVAFTAAVAAGNYPLARDWLLQAGSIKSGLPATSARGVSVAYSTDLDALARLLTEAEERAARRAGNKRLIDTGVAHRRGGP